MKYIFRLLATMPAVCVAAQTVLAFVVAIDYHWYVIPCLFSLLATVILFDNVENIANNLEKIVKNVAALW